MWLSHVMHEFGHVASVATLVNNGDHLGSIDIECEHPKLDYRLVYYRRKLKQICVKLARKSSL